MNKTMKRKKQVQEARNRSRTVRMNEADRMGVVFDEIQHYEIRLEHPSRDSQIGPTAVCSCNEWSFGPSTSFKDLGDAAKKHVKETGHQLRSV